jgi:hypothetical protein
LKQIHDVAGTGRKLPAVKTAGFGGFSTSFALPSTVSYTQMAVMRWKSEAWPHPNRMVGAPPLLYSPLSRAVTAIDVSIWLCGLLLMIKPQTFLFDVDRCLIVAIDDIGADRADIQTIT